MNGHTIIKEKNHETFKEAIKFDPEMTQMLESVHKDIETVIINMFKDLKENVGIMSKQMGNLIREMDKLTVDWTQKKKRTLVNLQIGQKKLCKLKQKEKKKRLRK